MYFSVQQPEHFCKKNSKNYKLYEARDEKDKVGKLSEYLG